MQVKVLSATLLLLTLLVGCSSAGRLRQTEKLAQLRVANESKDLAKSTAQQVEAAPQQQAQRAEQSTKDVHKRGIFYHGASGAHLGGLTSHAAYASHWPKTYAAHYGYSLNLPGATAFSSVSTAPSYGHSLAPSYGHSLAPAAFAAAPHVHAFAPTYAPSFSAPHAPSFVKYPGAGGFHLKSFAAAPAVGFEGHAVSLGGQALGLGGHAVGLGGHAVGLSGHPVSLGGQALGLGGHAVGLGSHAVGLSGHPVSLGGHPVSLGDHAVGLSGHAVGFGAPAFSLGGHAVGFGAPAALPAFATSAVGAHAHGVSHFGVSHVDVPLVAPAAPAPAPAPVSPFVLRPGGAVVSSYNVNYPQFHHRPALAVPHVPHVAPVQPLPAVASVPTFHPLPAVQPLRPVQPVHPVVQVQHTPQPFPGVHPFHHPLHPYFQTTFVQPPRVPIAPITPAVPALPAFPTFPAIPSFPQAPAFPNIPTFPSAPAIPPVPAVPAIPTTPVVPTVAVSPNPVFPIGVQPPSRPQLPPTFVGVQPEAQFPPVVPLPGSRPPNTGTAEAAPQIPSGPPAPAPIPEPEIPQPTEQPWKPILTYGPPSNVNRPANTLLPPYGSAPGEAYLPPSAPAQQHQQLQQAGIFDNLSDAEIEHIFAQAASLAAQDQSQQQYHRHHHHQHRYSHY